MARVELASSPLGVITDEYLNPLPGRAVTIRNPDGSNATTYSAYSGGSSDSTGTLTSNSDGTLPRWAEGADYLIGYTTPSGTVISRRLSLVSGSVESRVPSISVKDTAYGAKGDGVTDDTAAIAAAITAANTLGTATQRCRVYFPEGIYLVDSILLKSNIWLDLGGALIKKRIDGAGTSTDCIIRALEVDAGGGNYYGTYSNIKVSGGFLEPNGKTCPGFVVRMNFIDGWEIDGLTVLNYPADAKWAIMVGGRKGLIQRCKIFNGTAVFQDGIHVWGGQDIRVLNNYIESGDDAIAVGSEAGWQDDPIRNVTCVGNVVKAEKGFALKVYVGSGLGTRTVTGVTVIGLTGRSGQTRNGGISIWDVNGAAAGASPIKGVQVRGVDLQIGSTTHDETNAYAAWVQSADEVSIQGRVRMTDKTAAATGFRLGFIRDAEDTTLDLSCDQLQKGLGIDAKNTSRLKIRGKLKAGANATHPVSLWDCPNTDIAAEILEVVSGSNGIEATAGTTTSLAVRGRIAHASGATTGKAIRPSNLTKLVIEPGTDLSGSPEPVDLANARLIPLLRAKGVIGVSEPSLVAPLLDDFWGDFLADEWAGWKGTDAAAVVPTSVAGVGGAVRLTTGADAAGTHTVNGSRLDMSKNFLPSKGGLVFECRVQMSAITGMLLYVGWTSTTGSAQNPAELAAGDVLTTNPNDMVGFLFDTNADTDNWWAVGSAAGVDATKQNLGVAPVAATNEILRIEVTTGLVATFFRNGVKIGSAMASALTSVALTPVISAVSRGAASRTVDVDYILCEQNR